MPSQFADFYQSLDPDAATRGRQFEHFVKWFLLTDPEWSTQVAQVWLWNEWPDRWGPDCGIDLVFRHKNGEHWAVQAKCYSPDYHVTKHDVDKFLSESNRRGIDHRMLIATTDLIGSNARQVCEAQEKPVVRFLLSDFERAEVEYPSSMRELAQAKRRPPPQPREHQVEAIAAATQGLQDADRGQLIMACGTGKTYVTLWVKESLGAQRTLVLVPSLGLLSQLLREWTFAATAPFEALCVCSDQSVGTRGEDEAIHSVGELAFPVTSDAGEIQRFLAGAGNRVIFSTYQSSAIVALAQVNDSTPQFDLIVADEAHRCAGKVDGAFSTVLDGTQIRGKKRLFATATPRTYAGTVKKAAEERGVEVVGMDDAALFGEVLYALPFGQAIARKLLTDYRVVIIGVDDPTIAEWIANRDLVVTGTGIETDTESLAAQIGVLKAIKDYDLRRVISFHSRVRRAEAFTRDVEKVMGWIAEEHRPSGTLRTDFVSGEMPASKRKVKLDQLKALTADERGILSNARCLSEGVDVPSLDGVAFIDPRSSQVDIIQAVGRAIRLSSDKKFGTIVLPVFIANGQCAAESIEATDFKAIWAVLTALKAHDDVLADELDQIRTEMGRRAGTKVAAQSLLKISLDLPATVDAAFGSALRTHLVEQVTASWSFWYGLLADFVSREKHCQVPAKYCTLDGFNLGGWVSGQRSLVKQLSSSRRERLEALEGWTWDVHAEQWDLGFRYLSEYASREGNSRVPVRYQTVDGYRLGRWVGMQRRAADSMEPQRKALLNSVPGWMWDVASEAWEQGYAKLTDFIDREGHCRVPNRYKTIDGFHLGRWVGTLRAGIGELPPDRRKRLEELPGWAWDALDEQWDSGFDRLLEYIRNEGDSRVEKRFTMPDGFRLGEWVTRQRRNRDELSHARQMRLEAMPNWTWDVLAEKWELGFKNLELYSKNEGNCVVPKTYLTADGYRLGQWVAVQRTTQTLLTDEQRERLQVLPGWVWDANSEKWDAGIRLLTEFQRQEGHCQVPQKYKTSCNHNLGIWVSNQRAKKERLSFERRAQLESIPGWVWDAFSEQWEIGFDNLLDFVGREGHCKVPVGFVTPQGFNLGKWVSVQRQRHDDLPQIRRERLEATVGWVWKISESLGV